MEDKDAETEKSAEEDDVSAVRRQRHALSGYIKVSKFLIPFPEPASLLTNDSWC